MNPFSIREALLRGNRRLAETCTQGATGDGLSTQFIRERMEEELQRKIRNARIRQECRTPIAMPAILRHSHPARSRVAANQPRHLRPAQPGHLLQGAMQQPARRLALPGILPRDQHPLHPVVLLDAFATCKPEFFAGPDNRRICSKQLLGFVHADLQSSA